MKNQTSNLATVALIFLVLIVGCTAPAESNKTNNSIENSTSNNSVNLTEKTSEKPINLSSKELTKIYEENEIAADEKYKDKTLAVSGKISNIAETLGNITVSLEGHNPVLSVICSFDESEKNNVMKLKKGQQATLIGKSEGLTGGLFIGLKDCSIQ